MEDFIQTFDALPDEKKAEFLAFIRFLKDTEDTEGPPLSFPVKDSP